MRRERVAAAIKWPAIIWLIGIINVVSMIPQLAQIIQTHRTEGLSLEMFMTILVIQIGFSLEGFFKRNRVLMITMACAASVTTAIIVLTIVIRNSYP